MRNNHMVQQVQNAPTEEDALRKPSPPRETVVPPTKEAYAHLRDIIPECDDDENDYIGVQDEFKLLVFGRTQGPWGAETGAVKPLDYGHEPLMRRGPQLLHAPVGSTHPVLYDEPSLQANLGRKRPSDGQQSTLAFCARQIVYLRNRVGLCKTESRIQWDRYPPRPFGVPDDSIWRRACLLGLGNELMSVEAELQQIMFGLDQESANLVGKAIQQIREAFDALMDQWMPKLPPTAVGHRPTESPEVIQAVEPPAKLPKLKTNEIPAAADEQEEVVTGMSETVGALRERAVEHGNIIRRDQTLVKACQDASIANREKLESEASKVKHLTKSSTWFTMLQDVAIFSVVLIVALILVFKYLL